MQTSRLLSFSSNSPSFGSFSSTVDLAAIAARVVEEFRDQEDTPQPSDSPRRNEDDDDESEFAFDCPSHVCSQPLVTADEIFFNGQIRPLNPYGSNAPAKYQPTPRRRRPALRKLMSEELRDPMAASNSSSEAEEDLNGVPPETYCVWTPPKQPSSGEDGDDLKGLSSSPSQSKIKSNSAGFSKRWKLRNLLYVRSSSEGNEKLVFPAPVKKSDEKEEEEEEEEASSKVVAGEEGREREETKRQTTSPYRKDMIGILRNVNGLSRHLRPF
ncbi:PREDICTED: uncharacterized protein LOC104726877 [Camelina sativa]|uniref:Uncharacterized protein LOC104726877 n=1 Tax=Camelina sativa TaxID=90675 RepID=A0ABM0UPF4_CAMSA|nr:PREDICTED: uncharacterized protein LOC104726877 [Camelina sativa]